MSSYRKRLSVPAVQLVCLRPQVVCINVLLFVLLSALVTPTVRRYDDAEKDLVEAINKDSKDPDTFQNLAVCSLHLGKPVTRFINQLKTLTPKPSAIEQLESLEAAFDSANSAYVTA